MFWLNFTTLGSVFTTTFGGSSFANPRTSLLPFKLIFSNDLVLISTLLNNHLGDEYPNIALNLLSILERLSTFPTEQSELNAWWVTELGSKPPKPKKSKKATADAESSSDEEEKGDQENDGENDDWRKFFDDEPATAGDGKAKSSGVRLHKMTIHQSLHSLSSHRAVFTRAWLTLLPRLSVSGNVEKTKALAARALNLMHRGVIPHLTRAILAMDWISACVDMGMFAPMSLSPLRSFPVIRWFCGPACPECAVCTDQRI